jgi:hypothetical protein
MMSFLKYDYELISYFLSMEFQRRHSRQAHPAAQEAGFLKTPLIALYYSMIDTAMTA